MKGEEIDDTFDGVDSIEDMEVRAPSLPKPAPPKVSEPVDEDVAEEHAEEEESDFEKEMKGMAKEPEEEEEPPIPSLGSSSPTVKAPVKRMSLSELGQYAGKVADEKKAASNSAFELRKEMSGVLISDEDIKSLKHPIPINLQRIMNENGIFKVAVDLAINVKNELERYSTAALKMSGAPFDMDGTFKGAVLVLALSLCRGDQGDIVLEITNDDDGRLVAKKQKLALRMYKEPDENVTILNPDLLL